MEIADSNVLFGFWPRSKLDSSLSTVVETAKTHKIQKNAICSIRGIFDDYVRGNTETILSCKDNQNLIPVATINPNHYLDTKKEIERCISEEVKFYRFFPQYQGWSYSYKPFKRIVERLSREKITMILPTRIGKHLEFGTISEIGDLVKEMGMRCILTDVYYGNLSEALVIGEEINEIIFESHLLNSPSAIELVVSSLGSTRIVFGSGSPFQYINSGLLPIMESSLTNEDKELVLSGNFLKLME